MNGCITVIVFGIAMAVLLAGIVAIPVYFLWNWTLPAVFGFKEITLLQALGLSLLCRFLFGGANFSMGKKSE